MFDLADLIISVPVLADLIISVPVLLLKILIRPPETDFFAAWLLVTFVYATTWLLIVGVFAYLDLYGIGLSHRINTSHFMTPTRRYSLTYYVACVSDFVLFLFPATCVFLALSWPFLGDLSSFPGAKDASIAVVWTLVSRFCFYTVHRAMHANAFLYEHVHKHHHVHKHFLVAVDNDDVTLAEVGLSALLPQVVSTAVAWCIFGPLSLAASTVRIVIEVASSLMYHSGYDFVPGARHHSVHHAKVNGNYGDWWLDRCFGTCIDI